MALMEGTTLVNVARVEIVTEETTPKTYKFETSDSVDIDPEVSKGEEKVHRVKNKILATNSTEDIVIGYNLKLKDSAMKAEILALVEGGTVTYDDVETTKVIKYEAPTMGSEITRTPFTLNVYTEEKDESGDILQYAKFTFEHCKGKPTKYSMKDDDFFVPEFEIKSRAKSGESPITVDFVATLPAV